MARALAVQVFHVDPIGISLGRLLELSELVPILGLPLLWTALHGDLLNLKWRLPTPADCVHGPTEHLVISLLLTLPYFVNVVGRQLSEIWDRQFWLRPDKCLHDVLTVIFWRPSAPEARELLQGRWIHLRLVQLIVCQVKLYDLLRAAAPVETRCWIHLRGCRLVSVLD